MKTAISLPDDLYAKAQATADRMGIPRSQLFAKAVAEYLEQHSDETVTASIDEVLADNPSELDSRMDRMQLMTMAKRTQDDTW